MNYVLTYLLTYVSSWESWRMVLYGRVALSAEHLVMNWFVSFGMLCEISSSAIESTTRNVTTWLRAHERSPRWNKLARNSIQWIPMDCLTRKEGGRDSRRLTSQSIVKYSLNGIPINNMTMAYDVNTTQSIGAVLNDSHSTQAAYFD